MGKIEDFTKIKTPTNQTNQPNHSAHICAKCYSSQLYLFRLFKDMLYFSGEPDSLSCTVSLYLLSFEIKLSLNSLCLDCSHLFITSTLLLQLLVLEKINNMSVFEETVKSSKHKYFH